MGTNTLKRSRGGRPNPNNNTLDSNLDLNESNNEPNKNARIHTPAEADQNSPTKEDLISRILDFVNEHSDVEQGTDEWHKLLQTTIGGSEPVAWGLINVYTRLYGGEPCIDYGNADKIIFDRMLVDVDDGLLVTSLQYIKFADGTPDHSIARDDDDAMALVGYIPFKIMQVYSEMMESLPGFKSRMMRLIEDFFV
jgi:hypothetical protein